MLILRNVTKTDNLINGIYHYEDATDFGMFSYDVQTREFVDVKFNQSDIEVNGGDLSGYRFSKIKKVCDDMIKANKYPETYKYYWY